MGCAIAPRAIAVFRITGVALGEERDRLYGVWLRDRIRAQQTQSYCGTAGVGDVMSDQKAVGECGSEPRVSTRARIYLKRGINTVGRSVKLQNLALLAGSIVLCLAGIELAVRLFFSQTYDQPKGIMRLHPTRIYDMAPNVRGGYEGQKFTTNSLGLKDFEIAPKTADTFRVICVGDSMTAGFRLSIENSYPKKLEQCLRNRHPEASVEVINFGVNGYGTLQELSRMREKGYALDPDLVILQIYPENDVPGNLRMVGKHMRSTHVERHEQLDEMLAQLTFARRCKNFLRRYSHAVVLVDKRWRILKQRLAQHTAIAQREPKYPVVPGRPWSLETSLKEYYPELEEGWQITENAVRELRDECRARRIVLHAFVIPAKFELTEMMVATIMRDLEVPNPDIYDFSTNWRRVMKMLERLEIPHIDLRAKILDTDRPEQLYLVGDGHLNLRGNEFLASVLEPAVWNEYNKWAGKMDETDGEARD